MEPYIYGAANPVTFSDPSGLCAGSEVFDKCVLPDGEILDQNTSRFRTPAEAEFANESVRCANGACREPLGDFLFGFGMAPFTTFSFVPALIEDPVGTAADAVNPVNWLQGLAACIETAQGFGECTGGAVLGARICSGVCRGPDLPVGQIWPWTFADSVNNKLNDPRLGSLRGQLTLDDLVEIAETSPEVYVHMRSGNINVVQTVDGRLLRVTLAGNDTRRIISVGPIRRNSVTNSVANGNFIPI